MASKNIVVTGATGNIGSRVVLELASGKQARVTAFVRDPAKAANLTAAGATLWKGSFENKESLHAAFAGADTLVLITSGEHISEQVRDSLDAARAAGIRKVVRVSSLKAGADGPTAATRRDGVAEGLIQASGLTPVILRGHCFMQNILHNVATIRGEGRIYFGTGEGKIGMIDNRDIADAAVAAALLDTWDGQTLELTGPAAIDYHAVAAAVGKALGREVTFVPVPPAAVGATARKFGVDEDTAQLLTDYCAAYAQGWGDFTTDNVAKLTGRPARSIDDFARDVLAPMLRAG
ncbi:NAD(P)H-binding protein [Polyangium sp. y55x31]|uniref:NAD(P)H-binding protein n=1 Tax=Polyangium sp. y55x31 TaxID=3042688 RepID=UPI0024825ACD|nr:NAD(P)H-binding protein [Polyangium sp. y55x31]MDI1484727.1 NAD(P)H-binding protein [Polyangium sp. y55x31]